MPLNRGSESKRWRNADWIPLPVWEKLSSAEQAQMVALWVERIDYDGGSGAVVITFHADCGQRLGQHGTKAKQEKCS